VVAGWGLGAVVFGLASAIVCFRLVRRIGENKAKGDDQLPGPPPTANSPFSTGKAAMLP
jgi:hypothetical protein